MLLITSFALAVVGQLSNPNASAVTSYALPSSSTDQARASEIAANRAGYLYGTSPLANSSYFPTGPLGSELVQQDVEEFLIEAEAFEWLIETDAKKAALAVEQVSSSKAWQQ